MKPIAHLKAVSDATPDDYIIQTLKEHCEHAANYACEDLECIGLENTALFCGRIHDMGKATKQFADYISPGSTLRKGEVNHTFSGVRYVFECAENLCSDEVREIIAYAVGAHHGQFDAANDDNKNGFDHRLNKEGVLYSEAHENFDTECFADEELKVLFGSAVEELESVLEKISRNSTKTSEYEFQKSLLARLILSAVIDGDRRDTAEFMEDIQFPHPNANWSECLNHIEEKLNKFPNVRPIDNARRQISEICKTAAESASGIFRLNVPTGAGKTLSGLRFAAAHAKKHNKRRIIFTSPLLSILDQNAEVIKGFIGNPEIITEHHSNIVVESNASDELKRTQLLTENWNSPVIITTLVQLLDTLFAGKTSCIRRMQALCQSVIVIDEVQTVPSEMLSLFNIAVNFLSEICGASIVLCSATQPCLEEAQRPIRGNITDIVPFDEKLWRVFKRTEIVNAGRMRLESIPNFILDQFENTDSLLVVCNLKSQASFLFSSLNIEGIAAFHLSAGMCMAHRKTVIKAMSDALEARQKEPETAPKVLCISTQVIEAGVDISFGCVIRLCTGLDSIVQAAGRCNRNGESLTPAKVHIINCAGESFGPLKDMQAGKDATISLLSDFKYHPESYPDGLTSDEAVHGYYSRLYRNAKGNAQDFPIRVGETNCTVFNLLSINTVFANEIYNRKFGDKYNLRQAFKTAGEHFSVFGSNTVDVIVPYSEGAKIIAKLCSQRAENDLKYAKALLKEAQKYTVSLYDNQRRKIADAGGLFTVAGDIALAISPEFYDSEYLGLVPEGNNREPYTF